jgi:hypothetical protein
VSAANGGQVQLRDATLSIAPATGTGFYALYANGAGSVIDARDVPSMPRATAADSAACRPTTVA